MAGESLGQTLQPTALVHEAYLRLIGQENSQWQNSRHFFSAAAEAMRRILIERARQKRSLRRGGQFEKVEFNEAHAVADQPPERLLAVDHALSKLEQVDHTRAELVKLHFFAGLSLAEAGALLGISDRTADRYWAWARSWLYREITRD